MRRLLPVLLCTFLISLLPFNLAAQDNVKRFNRHYLIVVDQTIPGTQSLRMQYIYNDLWYWLQGKRPKTSDYSHAQSFFPDPESVAPFDPQRDAISVFAFGLTGHLASQRSTSFGIINGLCHSGAEPHLVFNEVCDRLINERKPAYPDPQNPSGSLSDFLQNRLWPLFTGQDMLYEQIHQQSGITLSHFVYPLILRSIGSDETANEYILIVVSDFRSGLFNNNDSYDWETLGLLTSGRTQYKNYFERQINAMRAPFVQAEVLRFQAGDIAARGWRIIPKSAALHAQIYFTTGLKLKQQIGLSFKVSNARVAFPADTRDNLNDAAIVLSDSSGELARKSIDIAALTHDSIAHSYLIPDQTVQLSRMPEGDVTVSCELYTMARDDQGNSVLPVTLTASQVIPYANIALINHTLHMLLYIIVILALVLTIVALYRGRFKQLNTRPVPFSRRFTRVTADEGAVELPCWFRQSGTDSTQLRVTGQVTTLLRFALSGSYRLYVCLSPSQDNASGVTYYINDQPAKDWTEVKVQEKGEFSFNIGIKLNELDTTRAQRCGVRIDYKVESSVWGLLKHQAPFWSQDKLDFYVIDDLGTSWMAFDPGTTGSCVVIGSPSGTPSDPATTLVGDDVIPSRLIIRGSTAAESVAAMVPGDALNDPKADYVYGFTARSQWNTGNFLKYPHYLSIKKLLGYQNGVANLITVKLSNRRELKCTGLDLASLLVKGLYRDAQTHVSQLSSDDKAYYLGEGQNALPRRAVVCIPNNYTLPKTREMIESIDRLGQFAEIRYIYEAEAVLFSHLRDQYGEAHPESETIMVFDMGGATINLTMFRVDYQDKDGDPHYHVTTLGRIGYGVGGDTIDVALMETLLTADFVDSPKKSDEQQRHKFEKEHREAILQQIECWKIDLIKYQKEPNDCDILSSSDNMETALKKLYNIGGYGKVVEDDEVPTEQDEGNVSSTEDEGNVPSVEKMVALLLDSKRMKKWVYDNVTDAVKELMDYPDVKDLKRIDQVIFAGRSSLFPKIQDTVQQALTAHTGKVWHYNNANAAKRCVAEGACWYGIYSNLITLDNARTFGTYGFKCTQGGKTSLHRLIAPNTPFNTQNVAKGVTEIASAFNADGNLIQFYQVMGSSTGPELFTPGNRHKVNLICQTPAMTTTKSLEMKVDRQNQVTCSVTYNTDHTDRIKEQVTGRDITKENDWPYVFAADTEA